MDLDGIQVNFQSNTNSVDVEDTINEDDDVVELEEVQQQMNSKKCNQGKRKRRLTSPVWAFFEVMKEKSIDGKTRCKCKRCGAVFICDSKYGTGNLKRHSETCVRRDTRDIGQLIISQDQRIMSTSATKFDPEKFRELLVTYIVMHDLPLSFVEYTGVRLLLLYLRDVPLISRNTVKADVVKMYKREKTKIKYMLEATPGRISLTSDLWTSVATDGYLCVTAHFIDKDWVLQKRMLNFCFMPPPHNGVSLSDKIYTLLAEWGIENKLFCATLDNASSNDVFISMLRTQLNVRKALVCNGDFFHLRCCAHILNLIVQEGLKEIDSAIRKIRESVKYVKGSQVRKQKFLECVNLLSLDAKKGLRQDVPTRWNSTFLMLESALYYCRAFCHLQLSDSNYKHSPSSEWDKVEKISKFLGVFYDITCIFSGTKYPTSNLYFPSVFMAYLTLKQHIDGEDEYMKDMASQMFAKFEKYWSEFSMILAVAVILDPRYKIQFVDFVYKKLFGSGSIEFMQFREKLVNEYAIKPLAISATPSSSYEHGESSRSDFNQRRDVLEEFDTFESEEFGNCAQKTQLEQYLDEPRIDRNAKLDILAFWKANQFRYPELACMARDVLSIPVSTVASEFAFSVGGRVVDQYRSALKPDTVQALVCTRDWIFGAAEAAQVQLDELTEDVMQMDLNKEDTPSTQCSNSIQLD